MTNSLDCKATFTRIYAEKVWGDGSGGGSGEQARPYIDFVSDYVKAHHIGSVVDIGCGDGMVADAIDFWGAEYIGIEASEYAARLAHERLEVCILNIDALTADIPPADLILCKEVLQHLSNEQVQTLLDRTAHYPRRLFTNSTFLNGKEVNEDITTGDFRAVDLTLLPFNQPAKTVFTYGNWIVQELTKP